MTTNGFYVIIFKLEAYTLQYNTTIDKHITTAGGLVVKTQYICSIQVDTDLYCTQHPQQHLITVPTHTVLNPQLKVNAVTYFHEIPNSVFNRPQAKNPYQYILYV